MPLESGNTVKIGVMKMWTRYSTLALIALIGVLLPVLAFLQYHWLGELGIASAARLMVTRNANLFVKVALGRRFFLGGE